MKNIPLLQRLCSLEHKKSQDDGCEIRDLAFLKMQISLAPLKKKAIALEKGKERERNNLQ